MEDDFQVPDPSELTDPPKKKKASTQAAASTTVPGGSSVASARDGKLKLCGYGSCDNECKSGRRHCHHHHRFLDNARTQLLKNKGQEATKLWVDRCRDLEFANGQIEYMSKKSVSHGMFARAPLIDWVQWEQEFGVLTTRKSASQLRPFEEAEWIIRQVNKFGRDRDEMVQEWRRKLAGPWKRDNDGHKGNLRLWLPSKEYEEKGTTEFIKGSSKEGSKTKKNPKEWELDAFRKHSMEADFHHGHSFFGGASGHVQDDEDARSDEIPAAAEQLHDSMQNAASAAGDKVGPSPTKRKAAETLDGSEDELEAAEASKQKSKKPKKGGNMAGQRASLFEAISKQMNGKVSSLEARHLEAVKARDDEVSAPAPTEATHITTRKLYTDTLNAVIKLYKAWSDPASMSGEVEKFNEAENAKAEEVRGQTFDLSVQETIQHQSAVLVWALKHDCAAVCLERGQFLRTKATMQHHVSGVSTLDLDVQVLEKAKLIWRRMVNCLSQLETALKKAATDVAKHVQGCAAAAERNEKRRKAKEAKDAEAAHFKSVQDKVRLATADGANMPGVFKLPSESLESMKILTQVNALPADTNLSEPFVIQKSSLVEQWCSNPTVLQVLKNFGSRYKKVPAMAECGKVTQPYQPKGGLEPTEKFFQDLTANLREQTVDISEFAPAWNQTSWMFGLEPKRNLMGFMPNCAACFRCLAYGEMEVYCIPTLALLSKMKEVQRPGGQIPVKATELEEAPG